MPAAIVPDTESCFSAIPGAGFPTAAAKMLNGRCRQMVSFERANLRRALAITGASQWLQITANRIRSWRFNTLGPGSDTGLIRDGLFPFLMELTPPRTSTYGIPRFPRCFRPNSLSNLPTKLPKNYYHNATHHTSSDINSVHQNGPSTILNSAVKCLSKTPDRAVARNCANGSSNDTNKTSPLGITHGT